MSYTSLDGFYFIVPLRQRSLLNFYRATTPHITNDTGEEHPVNVQELSQQQGKRTRAQACHWRWNFPGRNSCAQQLQQGVTNRCRLSWLTNSAPRIWAQMRVGGGGGCGVSANEYSSVHGAQISFGDLTPYLTYELQETAFVMERYGLKVQLLGVAIRLRVVYRTSRRCIIHFKGCWFCRLTIGLLCTQRNQ